MKQYKVHFIGNWNHYIKVVILQNKWVSHSEVKGSKILNLKKARRSHKLIKANNQTSNKFRTSWHGVAKNKIITSKMKMSIHHFQSNKDRPLKFTTTNMTIIWTTNKLMTFPSKSKLNKKPIKRRLRNCRKI